MQLSAIQNTNFDHHALLLNLIHNHKWGPKPFRLINTWFSKSELKDFVTTEWRKLQGWDVSKKLKLIKCPIKVWNKEIFGNVDFKISTIEGEIYRLQQISEDIDLNDSELDKLKSLYASCNQWKIRKAQLYRQFSRCKNLC